MKKKFTLYGLIFALLFGTTYKAYLLLTGGFEVENIVLDLPGEKRWEIKYTEDEIEAVRTVLSQPFHYLAKGRQSYAFESEDGKYVLKFMKCQRFKAHWFTQFLPDRKAKMKEKKRSKKEIFTSFYIAKNRCSDESALVFLQLNPQPLLHKKVVLIDTLRRRYEVDIDTTPFVIQRKVTPIFAFLQQLIKEKKTDKIYSALKQVTDIVVTLSERGVRVADPALIKHQNIGFCDGKVAYIDIGSFTHVSPKKRARQIRRDYNSLDRLCEWLEKRNPQYSRYVKEQIAQSTRAAEKSEKEKARGHSNPLALVN